MTASAIIRLLRILGWGGLCGMAVLFSHVTRADVTPVDNQMLQTLQAQGVAIIDVRRPDEWQRSGMLEGSHGITFFDAQGRYDVNAWLDAVSRITKPDEPVVLVCELGARSIKIAQLLDQRLGFTAVHNVTEGMAGWLRQGLPVTPYKP